MRTFRTLVMLIVFTIAEAEGPTLLGAQSAPAASQPDSVLMHISPQKSRYTIGENPIAVLTITNTSSHVIWLSDNPYLERIYIIRKDGEPPKTELHRHLRGDVRPGDGPLLRSGPVAGLSLAPNSQYSQTWNLASYYDLSAPGEYSVYIEIYDPSGPGDGSGHWLRTNTTKFEVEAKRQ